jgi:Family of unknown function (DUF6188)
MAQPSVVRELPDGSKQYLFDQATVSSIRVSDQIDFHFGQMVLVVSAPFSLRKEGTVHHLDPRDRSRLGPALTLFPLTISWLWVLVSGDLHAQFDGGAELSVPSNPESSAWSLRTQADDRGQMR